jgi:group I intron endonuclease
MNYLIYKITNKLNNKIYVGKHKTDFILDDYFGSGLLLKRAIEKHGRENFTREILFECKTEEEMNQKEADIVDEDFIARNDTYNIMLGGCGGFDYINSNGKNHDGNWKDSMKRRSKKGVDKRKWLWENDESFKSEMIQKYKNNLELYRKLNLNPWVGRNHSDETKKKMSCVMKGKYIGKANPNFGNHWITDGVENKLVKKGTVPVGWKTGRV